MFSFSLSTTEGAARKATLTTPHGSVTTPMFMPVGTHGAVKGVSGAELSEIGSQVVLANTYHLYLRPGESVVQAAGGLHAFTGYSGPMLTDSGGFQVFSLGERSMKGDTKKAMRKVSEDGITFISHIDGSKHLLTPEKAIAIEQALGADIIMAFDQPVYGMSSEVDALVAMERTQRWLERSKQQWQAAQEQKQALFGIVQGGIHTSLHTASAEFTVGLDLLGYAIGGLSVGETKEEMWKAVESICSLLPADKPRYFMGLGDPYDIVEATKRGVDMYDCVAPTRIARHGAFWLPFARPEVLEAFYLGDTERLLELGEGISYKRLVISSAAFRDDHRGLLGDSHCDTWLPQGLAAIPRSALCHYQRSGEMLASRVLSLHNIRILHVITEHMRNALGTGRFRELTYLLTQP